MKITRRQLRQLIREALILERKSLATASDVARFRPQISDWADVLLDEFSAVSSRWDDEEVNEKRLKNMVRSVTDAVVSALTSVTSGMDYLSQKNQKKREDRKSHEKWDKERSSVVGSGNRYYGEWGST